MRKVIEKGTLTTLILGFIISFGFTSCSDDDDDHVKKTELIGNWTYKGQKEIDVKLTGASAEKKEAILEYLKNSYRPNIMEDLLYTLNEDGTFVITRDEYDWGSSNMTYTYSESNGTLNIYMTTETPHITYNVVNISGNTITLKYTFDLESIYWNEIDLENITITSATALLHLTRTNK